jgi:hypothetical protein
MFDFALYMPANMAFLALISGAVCGRCAQVIFDQRWSDNLRRQQIVVRSRLFALATLPPRRWIAGAIAVSLTVAVLIGLFEIRSVADIEIARRDAPASSGRTPDRSTAGLMEQIVPLNVALMGRMDDAEGQLALAQLWIDNYRARSVETWKSRNPGASVPWEVYEKTAPAELHAAALRLAHENRTEELEELQKSESVRSDLSNAGSRLVYARRACPLLGQIHLLLAELAPLVPSLGSDAGHLDRMRRVAPAVLALRRECSLLELNASRTDPARLNRALGDWRRLAELSPDRLPQMVSFVAYDLRQPEQVSSILPNKPVLLVDVAKEHFSGSEHAHIRRQLVDKATDLIGLPDMPDDVRHYVQGVILALNDDHLSAIEHITLAVKMCPDIPAWRYQLALLLQTTGQLQPAQEQASLCVRMEPTNERYDALLKQLIRSRSEK